jgi:predicted dehydrogenase
MNTKENVRGESRHRVAVVIGYGSIGRRHARTLAALGCSLVIVNRRENVRAQAKLDHPSARVIDRLQVLDRENFDWHSSVAVIASWGPSHAAFFHMLADRGARSILCEKPMAASVCLAHAMAERGLAEGIALGVNHTLRFARLRDAVERCTGQYQLGEPVAMVMTGGASCLLTNGVHWIDFATQLFGSSPRSVFSTASGEGINPRSPDLMLYGGTAIWRFEGGREAVISFSNRSSVFPDVHLYHREAVIRLGYIVGETDEFISATVLRRDRASVERFPAITRTGKPVNVLADGPLPGVRGFNDGLHAAGLELLGNDMRSASASVGVQSVSSCIGALVSARERKVVELPIDPGSSFGQETWPIS